MDAVAELVDRCHELLRAHGWTASHVQLLPGDVSPRRYARVELEDGRRAIMALYPADQVDVLLRFVTTTRLLGDARVRVPAILATDQAACTMLLEDLGHQTLFELGASWETLEPYYRDTVAAIERIQAIPARALAGLSPSLDRDLLRQELERTWSSFLAPRSLLGDRPQALAEAFDALCTQLTARPLVPCHRDLMVRNLLPLEPGRVAVIDHQDLRLGPRAYDLASLLNDSLFPPEEVVARIVGDRLDVPSDRLDYHRAAAQRTLKAIGTFAMCAARGSAKHAALIAPTLQRAVDHLDLVPEFSSLAGPLREAWQPTLQGL